MSDSPTTLTVEPVALLPVEHSPEQAYLHRATATNTRRAYQAAIRQFQALGGLLPANEASIAKYLTEQASRLNPRTLSLHLTALSHWHRYQHLPDPTLTPTIRKLLTGIARTHGRPKRKAKALSPEELQQLLLAAQQDSPLRAARDQALMLIAYFGACRRSELVAMQVNHLEFTEQGIIISIPRSKTDQFGEGLRKALPTGNARVCPVRALKHWLQLSGIENGPLFRRITRWGELESQALHADSINPLLKDLATRAGFKDVTAFSSHSLRRGFATYAARAGAEFSSIKRQGGWQNDATVRGYIEEGNIFDNNAASQLIDALFTR